MERELDWEVRMASRSGYEALLARWWGFHSVFEPMAAASAPIPVMEGRSRLHLIRSDLSGLGWSEGEIDGLPQVAPLPFLRDRAAMIGALYVLEGSTLGGQVIARHVERHLGPAIAAGACSYLQGYGKARTMPMWRAFLSELDEVEPNLHGEVVAGASATFEILGRWLPS